MDAEQVTAYLVQHNARGDQACCCAGFDGGGYAAL